MKFYSIFAFVLIISGELLIEIIRNWVILLILVSFAAASPSILDVLKMDASERAEVFIKKLLALNLSFILVWQIIGGNMEWKVQSEFERNSRDYWQSNERNNS